MRGLVTAAAAVGLGLAGAVSAGVTNATLQGLTDSASKRTADIMHNSGMLGLRPAVESCYRTALKTKLATRVTFCISEDLIARVYSTALGEDSAPLYFQAQTTQERVDAAQHMIGEQDSDLLHRIQQSDEESARHMLAAH